MMRRCFSSRLGILFLLLFLIPTARTFSPSAQCARRRFSSLETRSARPSFLSPSALRQEKKSGENIDVDGMQTAPYIFAFILFLSVWNFTIPTEFRRARICSEQQVLENPSSKCMTFGNYVSGIVQYYQNGGTFWKFDFSIDREDNIWITGPQEIIE